MVGYRIHIVQEFNKGIYDYIIATDESNEAMGPDSDDEFDHDEETAEVSKADEVEAESECKLCFCDFNSSGINLCHSHVYTTR